MEELAHAQVVTESQALGQLQFVSTSTSAVTAPTTVTSTLHALTLQGASTAHAQRVSQLWVQVRRDPHALALQVSLLMATAQLQYVRDPQAPILIANAIQLLLQIMQKYDSNRVQSMEFVGSKLMAVLT
jgi:hypothetical protein